MIRYPKGEVPEYAIFDFDGTVSLLREGWQPIMYQYFKEELLKCPKVPKSESETIVMDFVDMLTRKQTIFQCIHLCDAKHIADLAKTGNPIALETFKLEGYYLGKVIAAACNIVNPARVIISGGVSLAFPVFEEYLLKQVKQHIYTNANKELKIMPTALGYSGGLLGAAAVAVCGRYKKHGWGV